MFDREPVAPAWQDSPDWDSVIASPGPESPPAAPAADPAPPASVPTDQPVPAQALPAAPAPTETPGTQASAPTSAPPTPELAPPPATPAVGTAPPSAPPEPFSVKLAGRVVPLTGATIANGMITIPEATFRRQMQDMLHDPAQTRQVITSLRQEVEQTRQTQTTAQAQADFQLSRLNPILLEPDDAVAWERFMALRAVYPRELHKAEIARLEGRLAARDQEDTTRGMDARIGRWEREVLPGWLDDYVGQVLADPSLADLAQYQPFIADLKQALNEDADRFLKATGTVHPEADLPEFEGDPEQFARIVTRVARPHRAYIKQLAALEAKSKPALSAPAVPPGGSVSQPTRVTAPPQGSSGPAKKSWQEELAEADLTS